MLATRRLKASQVGMKFLTTGLARLPQRICASRVRWHVFLAALAWFFLAGAHAHALTWERSAIDCAMDLGDPSVVAEFPFKNEGTAPVVIRELKASCGCTEPTVDSRVIQPGAAGVVKAIYTAGDRVGAQTAQLTVVTDEADGAPVILQLRVNIQPAVSLTPRLVRWSKADGLISRSVEIKRLGKAEVSFPGPMPVVDGFSIELKAGVQSGTWSLVLTPKSVEADFTAKLELPIKVGERTATYSVFAVLR